MLQVRNLSLSVNKKKLLHNVNFDIQPQEFFTLIGESGSGKSITCLSILNLLNANYTKNSQIIFQGKNLLTLNQKNLQNLRGKDIAYIPQEPLLNPTVTVYKQLQEVFFLHDLKDETDALLKNLDIDYITKRTYPHQLSGGQKQKIMVAMAVALNPKLIIADEPTTAQDQENQLMILKQLKALKKQTAVLLVTHDFSLVKNIANRVGIMKDGSLIELFKPSQKPKLSYSQELISSDPQGRPVQSLRQYENTILSVKNLTYKNLYKNLSFQVTQGKTLGIMGPIGSGKTTLAYILSKIIPITYGEIIFNNQNITHLKEKTFRKLRPQIQLILQTFGLNPKYSVLNLLKEPHPELDEVLYKRLGLSDELMSLRADKLSGGQKQRVALYRALRLKPELLILDEPTASLDKTIQKEILLLLKELQRDLGLTYIFISHDKKVLNSIAHNTLKLHYCL
ncbi:MAG: ABC transporter ATP-binding protein [Alphaproteobacteria bacterium]|nr:MAG: ABC transporter ATP-binding protein [Alphaproteobacteria bacterium]